MKKIVCILIVFILTLSYSSTAFASETVVYGQTDVKELISQNKDSVANYINEILKADGISVSPSDVENAHIFICLNKEPNTLEDDFNVTREHVKEVFESTDSNADLSCEYWICIPYEDKTIVYEAQKKDETIIKGRQAREFSNYTPSGVICYNQKIDVINDVELYISENNLNYSEIYPFYYTYGNTAYFTCYKDGKESPDYILLKKNLDSEHPTLEYELLSPDEIYNLTMYELDQFYYKDAPVSNADKAYRYLYRHIDKAFRYLSRHNGVAVCGGIAIAFVILAIVFLAIRKKKSKSSKA